jgi:hypothetical protein
MALPPTLMLFPEEKLACLGQAPKGITLLSWEKFVRASASPAEVGKLMADSGLFVLGPHYVGPSAADADGKLPDLYPMWQALAERITGPSARTVFLLPGRDYRLTQRRQDDGYAGAAAATVGHALKAVEYLAARCLPQPQRGKNPPASLTVLDPLSAADELVPRGDLQGDLANWLSDNSIGCRMWLNVDQRNCQPAASYRHSGQPGALFVRYPSGARALVLPLAGDPGKRLFGLVPVLRDAFETLEVVANEEKAIQVIPVADKDTVELRAFDQVIRIAGKVGKLLITLSARPGQHFSSKTLMKHIDCASLPALEQQYKLLRTALRDGGLTEEQIKRVIQARKPYGADRSKQYWMPA